MVKNSLNQTVLFKKLINLTIAAKISFAITITRLGDCVKSVRIRGYSGPNVRIYGPE